MCKIPRSRQGLTRRQVMTGIGATSVATALTACSKKSNYELDALWAQWQADWRKMEVIAKLRGWDLTPLAVAPPVTESEIGALEARYQVKVPKQLRALLTGYASGITFGWRVPHHLRAMERVEHLYPTGGGMRDHIFELDHIAKYAIPNFLGWSRDLASRDLSEAPNAPEMWHNQFAIGDLPNGDMLTIDVSRADGPQPVRYFSHEVEGLHGHELAPDLFTFISVYSALGCAGSTHDDWFTFVEKRDDVARISHLSRTGAGAQAWLAWRDGRADTRDPDDPPPAVLGTSAADRALLTAAHLNSDTGVTAALAAGAKIDCIWNSDWGDNPAFFDETEFWTALTHAVRHGNLGLVDLLVKRGATLNTRHLPLSTAVEQCALETVKGLIERGARVDGWRHQRHWPLHLLVTRRAPAAAYSRDDYRQQLIKTETQSITHYDELIAGAASDEARALFRQMKTDATSEAATRETEKRVNDRLALHIDGPTYDAMLEALLKAGAKPDAPWDNDITMLMHGGVATSALLLKYGAKVDVRDAHGRTVLHWAHDAEKARLLKERGADINARAAPQSSDAQSLPYTPLQSALLGSRGRDLALVKALLALGADPKLKDGIGNTTLAYCLTVDAFKMIETAGLDAKALLPGGRTLLHNLAVMTSPPRVTFPDEVAFFKFLLSLGLDINAQDE